MHAVVAPINQSSCAIATDSVASKDAEQTFESFRKSGSLENIKKVHANLNVLNKEFKACDIAPVVEVQQQLTSTGKRLIRRGGGNKLEELTQVSNILSKTMESEFTGNPQTADLILLVRVCTVSRGNAVGRRVSGGRLLGRLGMAKLVVSYCLFSRQTGRVGLAKEMCYGHAGCTNGGDLVRYMADKVGAKICRETKFIADFKGLQDNKKQRRVTTAHL
jgi:hypothetical protein